MSIYLQEMRGEVNQGDVFDSLSLSYITQEDRLRTYSEAVRAMLLTYDCEYDKASTRFVMVAQVFRLDEVPADRQENVRKKVFSTFYLEAADDLAELFVDFRFIGRLDKAIVAERAQAGHRLVSLSDEAQLALQEQLSAFFGYGRGR